MKVKITALVIILAIAATVLAAPAPYYKWKSKLDGKTNCTNVLMSGEWEIVGGPYKDSACTIPGKPGE